MSSHIKDTGVASDSDDEVQYSAGSGDSEDKMADVDVQVKHRNANDR